MVTLVLALAASAQAGTLQLQNNLHAVDQAVVFRVNQDGRELGEVFVSGGGHHATLQNELRYTARLRARVNGEELQSNEEPFREGAVLDAQLLDLAGTPYLRLGAYAVPRPGAALVRNTLELPVELTVHVGPGHDITSTYEPNTITQIELPPPESEFEIEAVAAGDGTPIASVTTRNADAKVTLLHDDDGARLVVVPAGG